MSRARRIVLAVNPAASFGRSQHVGPLVARRLREAGHEVISLAETTMDELAHATREAVEGRPDALVVVGGDGMVHLGVGLVAGTRIPLGIVPSGTGNDLARGLGIPLGDPDAATDSLLAALEDAPRVIDAAKVHRDGTVTWFAGVLSAGFDAVVNERANRLRRPRGRSRYTVALLRELLTLSPHRYRLVIDGEALETDAVLLSVANNSSLGGGMRIAPDALLDDGLLDVVVVAPVARTRFLRLFPRVFSGTHTALDIVEVRTARRVSIEASAVVAYADGERLGSLPVEVEVAPAALRVLA